MAEPKWQEVKDILLPALKEGMPKTQACALAGISRQALYKWIDKGEKGEKPYVDIVVTIKKAQAEFVQDRIKGIKKAGDNGNWQANAWTLERLFPEDFAKHDKVAFGSEDEEGKFVPVVNLVFHKNGKKNGSS